MRNDQVTRTDQRTRLRPRSTGGAIAVLLGAAAWGSTGTAAHFAPDGAAPASVGAARIALGGLLLLAIALATTDSRRAVAGLLSRGPRSRAVLLLAAAAVAGYQVCFFTAVRETGVAVGTVVAIGSAPVFTGALSRITGGSPPGRRWVLATASAVLGCTVLIASGHPAAANAAATALGGASPAGVGLALGAGLCYAVYAVAAARLISAGSPETAVMGLLFGAGAVLLSPLLLASSPGWVLTGRGLAVTAYLGIVTTVLAYLCYGRGLRTVPAPVAVTLGLAEPVIAAILGLVVLAERLTAAAVVGLVLVGLALTTLIGARTPVRQLAAPPG
ncbi:MAG: DMT family transporter [Streptosporangiaceae bacterium]